MPRQIRIQFPGATYHLICRGDRGEAIFRDDGDREMMLATLAETVKKTGWLVHAWVWMSNHYHLVVETPEPNLVKGMAWFQTTYTTRFNVRHGLRGHLFGGRYKAVLVQAAQGEYFSTLLDYIHLNPVRAGIVHVSRGKDLRDYPWSSWAGYLHPSKRQPWHCVSRAFAAWSAEDTVEGRRAVRVRLEDRMAAEQAERCGLSEIQGQSLQSTLRRGWYYGTETFRERVLEQAEALLKQRSQRRKNYHGDELKAHDVAEARMLLRTGLEEAGLDESELPRLKKRDSRKVMIAARIYQGTAVPLDWIAKCLFMGTPSNVSHVCRREGCKPRS